ncbi:hypothetical protein M0R45_016155 [Rubus argutus]|uniref:Uncharacterized protein n=1 Tax=Rubus argutus TaxID=59490 RepID=A0AAW1XTN0_RUBAR
MASRSTGFLDSGAVLERCGDGVIQLGTVSSSLLIDSTAAGAEHGDEAVKIISVVLCEIMAEGSVKEIWAGLMVMKLLDGSLG